MPIAYQCKATGHCLQQINAGLETKSDFKHEYADSIPVPRFNALLSLHIIARIRQGSWLALRLSRFIVSFHIRDFENSSKSDQCN